MTEPSRGAVTGAWAPLWSLMKERIAVTGADEPCGAGRANAVAAKRAEMVAMVNCMLMVVCW